MNSEFVKIILKRFAKAFVAGAIGGLLVALNNAPALGTLADLRAWAFVIALGAFNGGLLAIEKLLQGYRPQ